MTRFSVVTPSFQQRRWLELAAASIADQTGPTISVEHWVQDGQSTDGTDEILARNPEIQSAIEQDSGMYDAINRGLQRARGEILSYLNCDEQYLPGALAKVADFFQQHPEIDLLFGGFVVVNEKGEYICSRKVVRPILSHTRVCHLNSFTCSMFFRRKVFEEKKLSFDAKWKVAGDAEWVTRGIEAGLQIGVIPEMIAVFTDTGSNLGNSSDSLEERNRLRSQAPWWQRRISPLIAAHHRIRRCLHGGYNQEPFDYAIYTTGNRDRRTVFHVPRPTALWKDRFTLLR